jgi:hypothetical protein
VAATKVAPPSIIAQAGAALLDQIAARNSIDQEAAANAVGKAMEQLIAGVRHRREGAVFFFASRSREGRIEHRTDRDTCSCEAGREGIACWHRAARHLIITLMRQQECASAQAAERAGELPPPPAYCRHCHHRMITTTTPAGEACYECERCRWTVMAALFAPALLAQDQADPAPPQAHEHRSQRRAA